MVQTEIKPWHFTGDYFESCNCEVNCPCVFGTPAHYETCDVALAWHIGTGYYGETALDGLSFSIVARTPKQMSDGNWTMAIYLDERASDEQREALRLIAAGEAGGGFARRKALIGTLLGVKPALMTYEVVERRRRLTILNALEMEVEAVKGARPDAEVTLVNDPRAGERGFKPRTIAKTVTHRFSDYNLSWDNTGKTGYYSPVEMSGP
jgi:hypothetical protein